ncbi:hypothetical protein R6Q59_006028 [Mikania micrantha]
MLCKGGNMADMMLRTHHLLGALVEVIMKLTNNTSKDETFDSDVTERQYNDLKVEFQNQIGLNSDGEYEESSSSHPDEVAVFEKAQPVEQNSVGHFLLNVTDQGACVRGLPVPLGTGKSEVQRVIGEMSIMESRRSIADWTVGWEIVHQLKKGR